MTLVLFYLVLGSVCLFLGVVIADWRTSCKLARRGWQDLVAELHKVYMDGITAVATDYLIPTRDQLEITPDEIWDFVGGYQSLKKMRENAAIMLELAAFAQRWNFDEAMIVTERMRLDSVSLRRAVLHVELGLIPAKFLRRFQVLLPIHAQEAAAAYYLMRQRLLALYEASHAGLYPVLASTL